jgi:hypothetical protein
MFLIIIMDVVLTVSLIGVGLLLMQQEEQAPPRPASRPSGSGSGLAPGDSHPVLSKLPWQRPWWVPWPLTTGKAVLFMIIGLSGSLDFIGSLGFLIWLEVPLGIFSFLFPVGGGVLFFLGLRDWQRIRALETTGQMTQGVVFDRWINGNNYYTVR